MYGINDHPVVELDDLIDWEGYVELKDEVDFGLAQAEWEMGSFGPGVYHKDLGRDLYHIEQAVYYGQEDEKIKERLVQLGTQNRRRLYLKLKYGLYNPNSSVYLRKPIGGDYLKIEYEEGCEDTSNTQFFPNLMQWIRRLPMEEVGRVLLFVNEHSCHVQEHSDFKHSRQDRGYKANNPHQYEFIWIRDSLETSKSFYVLDELTGNKFYVEGHAAWFNSFDVHGADPSPNMTYSLRVDGRFTTSFRAQILGQLK
mgnify:CR=1 FL=1